ncbi:hypothetical protein [Lysobacter sp. Root604]|uniref:hypothetical protein n=1 Tax=Lysobacter sp. Root604 TaxID=1736568 RepID=UPI0012F7F3EB|nr:hypothetical protein [Lysobacter sp. Root604]
MHKALSRQGLHSEQPALRSHTVTAAPAAAASNKPPLRPCSKHQSSSATFAAAIRAGSAMIWIATMRSSTIVKAKAARGVPSGAQV